MQDTLFMPDVGHGQMFAFGNHASGFIQVDWGGSSDSLALGALEKLPPCGALVLTHFHQDHYRGLLAAVGSERMQLHSATDLWIPRLPEFPERAAFARALACMTLVDARRSYGLDQYDVREWFHQITSGRGAVHQVSAGDQIVFGERRLEVLWPPRRGMPESFTRSVRTAIEQFHRALQTDAHLAEAYDVLSEIEQGLWEGPMDESLEPRRRPLEEVAPKPTVDANDALRTAANRLSLVFRDRQRLLVWGDVEKAEIKLVESELWRQRFDRFVTATAPHHGTRWPKRLGHPRVGLLLVQNGRASHRNFDQELTKVATMCLSSFMSKDLLIHYDDHAVLPDFDGAGLWRLEIDSNVVAVALRLLESRRAEGGSADEDEVEVQ